MSKSFLQAIVEDVAKELVKEAIREHFSGGGSAEVNREQHAIGIGNANLTPTDALRASWVRRIVALLDREISVRRLLLRDRKGLASAAEGFFQEALRQAHSDPRELDQALTAAEASPAERKAWYDRVMTPDNDRRLRKLLAA